MKTAPDFWWKPGLTLWSALLSPIAWIYGLVSGRRMLEKTKSKAKLPVICVGNFVVGGTGKTPFALRLAEMLEVEGYRPGFLLRGYGGSVGGPLLVDIETHNAASVGDEALLLAPSGPTVVAADRSAGAELLETQDIDIIVMDDGFQNPSLSKDLSLVLVDCAIGLGNGKCIPAGPLRAPVKKQILKADCLVLVGEGERAEPVIHLAGRKGLPILHAKLVPERNENLVDKGLYAFAGIGHPEKFFKSLNALGLDVVRTKSFADHHEYTETDIRTLLSEAEDDELQLVTTTKDMARIETTNGELYHWLSARTDVLNVRMSIEGEQRLRGLINELLSRRKFHSS